MRERLPVLWESCHQFASLQIRNTATIGGNICRASPSGETLAPLLVLEAKAKLAFAGGETVEPFTAFFQGPGKSKAGAKGLLTEINVPYPAAGSRASSINEKLYPIHTAKAGGLAWKLLMTLSGLGLTLLGLLATWSFWFRKAKKRKRPELAKAGLEAAAA